MHLLKILRFDNGNHFMTLSNDGPPWFIHIMSAVHVNLFFIIVLFKTDDRKFTTCFWK
jgi:hypothetical protein